MKHFKFFFIFFLLGFLRGSSQNIIQLPIPGDNGLLLEKGWKYKMADDSSFALPLSGDAGWEAINPTRDIFDSLPTEIRNGVGWLRLKMEIPPPIRNKTLGFLVQQSGASQIYLNGVLIANYGNVSSSPEDIKTYDPRWKTLPVHFTDDPIQLLAVRFTLKPNQLYTTIFETSNPIIVLRLYTYQRANWLYSVILAKTHAFEFILAGVCLMLLIIHLSLYILYPLQKANLYFAFFALSYIIAALLQTFYYVNAHEAGIKFYTGNLTFSFFMACDIFILFTIKTFVQQKADIYFKILIPSFLLALFMNVYFYDWGWRVGGIFFKLLTQSIILVIAIRASNKNYRGARVFVFGALATVILFFTFILQGTFFQNNWVESLPLIRMINYLLYSLSIPLAVSIFLASDFAFTTRRLQQKLREVNELSEKNLAVEKEKQEILSTQNIQLEKLVDARTSELKQSLEHLKSTQAQLIQSEKMASLGELTAGIAHEIQNPLNFVNNFSEINKELIDELQTELKAGKTEDALAISNNIKENETKILHHGKRADAIVKGMRQHSRASTGKKEPTDINALADEYLRLSYHGLRARDKTFNATLKTDFDESIGKIDIVPQDMGRVVLNLINNAFYAASPPSKGGISEPDVNKTPTVWLSTKKLGDKVLISVRDNGPGIPQKILDKIFQPFYTTKPPGQGTGLGLSLAYDIVKAHGGELKVETKDGEGAEFSILLPA